MDMEDNRWLKRIMTWSPKGKRRGEIPEMNRRKGK
jgi:hypothetical protein